MRPALLTVLNLMTALAGCHRAAPASPAAPPLVGDGAQITEAVFRHLFANNASAVQGRASVYCLRVDGPKIGRAHV